MNGKTQVFEFSGDIGPIYDVDTISVFDRNTFLAFLEESVHVSEPYFLDIEKQSISPFCYGAGHEWVGLTYTGDRLYFLDRNKDNSVVSISGESTKTISFDENVYYEDDCIKMFYEDDDCEILHSLNKTTGEISTYNGWLGKKCCLSGSLIGYDCESNRILSLSYDLKQEWAYSLSERVTVSPFEVLIYDGVICYLLELEQGERSVLALDSKTGEKVWETKLLSRQFVKVYSVDKRAYFTGKNQLLILAIEDGTVILDKESLFDDGDRFPCLRVLPNKGSFWCFSTDGGMRVLDENASAVLRDFRVSPPKTAYAPEDWYLEMKLHPNGYPYFYQGKVICAIALGVDRLQSALVVFDDDIESNAKLEYQARPEFKISEYSHDGGHGYRIEIDHEDEHELVRFSQIQLIELARYYAGTTRYSTEGRDRNFSGQLVLSVQNKALSDEVKLRLDQMRQEVEWMLEDQGYYAEKNKANIIVKIEYPN